MKQLPIFVTGNQDKADHLARLLGVELQHQKVDLDEIQSASPEEIVEHKVRQAYSLLNVPVLIDDVSMGFDELGGLPGPFIKFFVGNNEKLDKLCRMCDGLASRRASGNALFGYYDGSEVTILKGEIFGVIADHPRGGAGFAYGWDKIFCPDGYDGRTRAELNQKEYDEVYRHYRPIEKLKQFLTN